MSREPETRTWTDEQLAAASSRLEEEGAEAALQWALGAFGTEEIALACSFGAEDLVLVDMVSKIRPGTRVFYLDTHLLFPETYRVIEAVSERYPISLIRYEPLLSLAEQAEQHGEALWESNPDGCCAIRKVEPLTRALQGLGAWITGIRRDQAPTRANTPLVQWDPKFNLVKVNPLAQWNWEGVWSYIRLHRVPYNELHDRWYPSIGCTHCTRPVRPGEDLRAGRWSGSQKTECGLHPA
jgi:phosphoadenosine phosphosulfate reductase